MNLTIPLLLVGGILIGVIAVVYGDLPQTLPNNPTVKTNDCTNGMVIDGYKYTHVDKFGYPIGLCIDKDSPIDVCFDGNGDIKESVGFNTSAECSITFIT